MKIELQDYAIHFGPISQTLKDYFADAKVSQTFVIVVLVNLSGKK